MVCSLLQLRAEASWFGKDSLFQPPFGGLMRWLGGIPVDREQPNNVVARTAQALIANPDMVLCVAPEGTRKKVVRWRTGFYFIALQARVPIVLVAIDARQRQVRYLGKHSATGNAECEIDEIRQKFAGFSGLIAENSLHCQD